jgi:hypothetical protein
MPGTPKSHAIKYLPMIEPSKIYLNKIKHGASVEIQAEEFYR